MDQFENNYGTPKQMTTTMSKSFVSSVFMWMFVALGITAGVAYIFGTSTSLFMLMFTQAADGVMKMNLLGWVVMFAPLIIVLIMSFRVDKLSVTSMVLLFLIYSVLMGMSMSFIFWAYTSASIFKTFIITAGMFGVMAIVGYTTKTDLTRFGSILIMALIGIIIATLVNFFTKSAGLDYFISFIGVLIFTGLTAYDVQKIKKIGESGIVGGDTLAKLTIHAALSLYLDFLNLFLYLLRFFGNSRN